MVPKPSLDETSSTTPGPLPARTHRLGTHPLGLWSYHTVVLPLDDIEMDEVAAHGGPGGITTPSRQSRPFGVAFIAVRVRTEKLMTTNAAVLEVQKVGIAGWGRMGSWMGHYLIKDGWEVLAFDPSPDASESIRSFGATATTSLAALAEACDLVLVVVVDDDQVRDVIRTSLPSARKGTIFAVCASVRPDTCEGLAREAAAAGCHVIDVALVGGERGAEAGALKLMCGGEKAPIDASGAAFAAFAIDVCHVGDIGAGQIAKTVNNILLWACIRADVEALRLAKKLGISPGRLRSFVNIGSGANAPLREWGQHRLRWPKKDLEVALALAADAGVDMPFVKALAPLMDELSVDDLHELR